MPVSVAGIYVVVCRFINCTSIHRYRIQSNAEIYRNLSGIGLEVLRRQYSGGSGEML